MKSPRLFASLTIVSVVVQLYVPLDGVSISRQEKLQRAQAMRASCMACQRVGEGMNAVTPNGDVGSSANAGDARRSAQNPILLDFANFCIKLILFLPL